VGAGEQEMFPKQSKDLGLDYKKESFLLEKKEV